MPVVEILCLANSKKHGGRCIAGITSRDARWIRPVAPSEDGALYPLHYLLPDGSEPQIFDVLRVEVVRPTPKPHQPENWLIGGRGWELVARPAPDIPVLLSGQVEPGPVLFGTPGGRVAYDALLRLPARSSLSLVIPEDLKWHVASHVGRGIYQVRAHFRLGGATYDLVVTDPRFLESFDETAPGIYPASAAGMDHGVPLLTVSLGEPYDGYCYKLVAAVTSVPSEWLAETAPPHASSHRKEGIQHQRITDAHLAEFARTRGSALGKRLVEQFSVAALSSETETDAVQRLRAVLEDALREELDETPRY